MCTRRDGAQAHAPSRLQAGLTLVELIVAMVLAGVVMGSIWSAWSLLGRATADPLVMRQQLAVAQSLLREIELQPLPGTAVAASAPGRSGFASIADYDGLAMTGITDAEGAAVPGLGAYGARVAVSAQALDGVPAASGWWVRVSVSGPDGRDLVLAQWRARR